jgi:hypothetical protein
MALIHHEIVHTQLLKGKTIVLLFVGTEFLELGFQLLLGTLQCLDDA